MPPKSKSKVVAKKKVVLAFTHGTTKTLLVDKLVKDYEVLIYNPRNDEEIAEVETLIAQIKVTNNNPEITQTSEIEDVKNFEPKMTILLNLDILPSLTDDEFYEAWYGEWKSRGDFVDLELTTLVFTQNYRGLIAGTAYMDALKIHDTANIVVSSSICFASRQLFGDRGTHLNRAIPTGGGEFYLTGEVPEEQQDQLDILDNLRGPLGTDDLAIVESQSLLELITEFMQTGKMDTREFLGMNPTKSYAKKNKLEAVFTWLPTNSTFDEIGDEGLKTNIRSVSCKIKKIKEDNCSEEEQTDDET